MFCIQCGKQLNPSAVICVGCGSATPNFGAVQSRSSCGVTDQGGIGWGLLGFFLSFIGFMFSFVTSILPLIFICIWKREFPRRTRSIFRGVLVDFIITVVVGILCVIGFIVGLTMLPPYSYVVEPITGGEILFIVSLFVGIVNAMKFIPGLITCIVYLVTKNSAPPNAPPSLSLNLYNNTPPNL